MGEGEAVGMWKSRKSYSNVVGKYQIICRENIPHKVYLMSIFCVNGPKLGFFRDDYVDILSLSTYKFYRKTASVLFHQA